MTDSSVSVVISLYNGGRFIEEQLESILRQTVSPNEVIILDDCSTDDGVKIVQDYIERNGLDDWLIERNDANMGFRANFRKLAYRASGDIVFFCDQDDIWNESKIEIMTSVLDKNENIELLCSRYADFATESELHGIVDSELVSDSAILTKITPHFGSPYIWLGCAMAVRKTFLDRIEAFWPDEWAHDECVWKLAQVAGGCFTMDSLLTYHRIHGSNATGRRTHNRERRVELIEEKALGDAKAVEFSKSIGASEECVMYFSQMLECDKLRIDLLRDRKPAAVLKLGSMIERYPEKKSYFVDLAIALGAL